MQLVTHELSIHVWSNLTVNMSPAAATMYLLPVKPALKFLIFRFVRPAFRDSSSGSAGAGGGIVQSIDASKNRGAASITASSGAASASGGVGRARMRIIDAEDLAASDEQ